MSEPVDLWAKAPAGLITDPDITATAKIVYLWIDLRAGKRGYWYGTRQEIADAVGVSVRAVSRATGQLRDRGYLVASREGKRDGVTTYSVPARTGHQRPILIEPEVTPVSIGRDSRVPSADAHPIPHRSIPRSNKRRIIAPTTDWDTVAERQAAKARRLIG